MFKYNWHHYEITTWEEAELMRSKFLSTTHEASGFDTETTGLHIIYDRPFLYQFGWITEDPVYEGYTYVIDLEQYPTLGKEVIQLWHTLAEMTPKHLAHNTKFDLHQLINIGVPYKGKNISDLMIYIRLGTDAIATKHGGAPLKLKDYAKRYVDRSAKDFEKELDEEKETIAKTLNGRLRKRLGWTQKKIDTFFKDKIHSVEDLPADKQQAYNDWLMLDLPLYLRSIVTNRVDKDMIRYDTLNRELVKKYGHYDIVWLLESYARLKTAVHLRGNEQGVAYEEANIYPILSMERVGLCVDVPYLEQAQKAMKEYIIQRREDLHALAGCELTVGQHAKIKSVIQEMYGVTVEATGNDELSRLCSDLKRNNENPQLVEFIETVQELRTLEKWYSTYIVRFLTTLHRFHTDRIYTQINLNGTVSGRVTSDFQQFPKDAIVSVDGRELFHPRRMIKVDTAKGYQGIVYLDYSQIELRLQAMYTILVGHPDLNLCRAYMPYECETVQDNKRVPFDCHNLQHIKHAYDWTWYHKEDGTEWKALDVHGATTKVAFGIDENHPDFHRLRYVGKRVNFAKNYGAQRGKIAEMFPEFDEEQIDKIDGAYYKAFPGVKEYHDYCYRLAQQQPYAQNLFGVRYYNVSGHNLINMLIQGTGAYFLKSKIVKVYNYLKEHHCKSTLQMQIHDELSFEWHKDDDISIFYDIKAIMEDWEDTLIPIVADMEITRTNWAEKVEV